MKSFIERDWLLPKNPVPHRITQEEVDEFVRSSQKAVKDFHKYALWVCYSDINRARQQGIKEGRRQERERCVKELIKHANNLRISYEWGERVKLGEALEEAIDVIKELK